MSTPNPLCFCGCGMEVSRPWHRFYLGHYRKYLGGEPGSIEPRSDPPPNKYGFTHKSLRPQEIMRKEDIELRNTIVTIRRLLAQTRKASRDKMRRLH